MKGSIGIFIALVFGLELVSQVVVDGIIDDSKHVGVLVDDSQYFLARGQ